MAFNHPGMPFNHLGIVLAFNHLGMLLPFNHHFVCVEYITMEQIHNVLFQDYVGAKPTYRNWKNLKPVSRRFTDKELENLTYLHNDMKRNQESLENLGVKQRTLQDEGRFDLGFLADQVKQFIPFASMGNKPSAEEMSSGGMMLAQKEFQKQMNALRAIIKVPIQSAERLTSQYSSKQHEFYRNVTEKTLYLPPVSVYCFTFILKDGNIPF